jgi:hypothetical protein
MTRPENCAGCYPRYQEREYIKRGREAGLIWGQVGEAPGLAEAAAKRGVALADAAFGYATDAEHAAPFETRCRPLEMPGMQRDDQRRGDERRPPGRR